jgi:hypothetical protein
MASEGQKSSIKKERFLKAFARLGSVTGAAKAARCHRTLHYQWLREDPEYPRRYAEAREQAVDGLEDEAIRRARDGVEEPVYQGGKLVGTVRKYSDTLLMFLLNGLRPDRYRRKGDVHVAGDVNVTSAEEYRKALTQMYESVMGKLDANSGKEDDEEEIQER